ncbi:MAG: hypothetical protein AAF960_10800 [Bacteroidota bacterium]
MKFFFQLFVIVFSLLSVQTTFAQDKMHKMDKMDQTDVTIIHLDQTPGVYETTTLNLLPGKYIFEVTNKNVDKKLGFYLTTTDADKAQVPNSGLKELVNKGQTARTGVVELTAGAYEYSCPLNPTPHYSLKVAGK